VNSFTCACTAGYAGSLCQTDINECASTPCVNGASCADGVNHFVCSCVAGWGGNRCQTDINECASGPCFAGQGACRDLLNGFNCTCNAGYTGHLCQTDINECASSPCQNGATCVDLVNGFFCGCARGYAGVLCEVALTCPIVNSQPCNGHGQCLNDQCSCDIGWCGQGTSAFYRCSGPLASFADCATADTELAVDQLEIALSGSYPFNNDTLAIIDAALGLPNNSVYYVAGGNPRVGPYGTILVILQLPSADAANQLSDLITSGNGIAGLSIIAERQGLQVRIFDGDEVNKSPILSSSAAIGLVFMGLCVVMLALALIWHKCWTPTHTLRVKLGHGGVTELVDVVDND